MEIHPVGATLIGVQLHFHWLLYETLSAPEFQILGPALVQQDMVTNVNATFCIDNGSSMSLPHPHTKTLVSKSIKTTIWTALTVKTWTLSIISYLKHNEIFQKLHLFQTSIKRVGMYLLSCFQQKELSSVAGQYMWIDYLYICMGDNVFVNTDNEQYSAKTVRLSMKTWNYGWEKGWY